MTHKSGALLFSWRSVDTRDSQVLNSVTLPSLVLLLCKRCVDSTKNALGIIKLKKLPNLSKRKKGLVQVWVFSFVCSIVLICFAFMFDLFFLGHCFHVFCSFILFSFAFFFLCFLCFFISSFFHVFHFFMFAFFHCFHVFIFHFFHL